MNEKLYVVVRSDLSRGDQLCQAIHAAVDWTIEHPAEAAAWHRSNYLVALAVPDELTLHDVAARLEDRTLIVVAEPDLNDETTAFAVDHHAGRLLSSLPLAFREPAMT